MIRFNCICFDCPDSGRFKVEAEEVPAEIICPNCGSRETKVLGQESGIFGKIASMSPQDKQKVLKKRSNDHYKKEIKEKKEYLDRAAVGLTK